MKCERCGCVIDNPETDGIWSWQGDIFTHIKKNDCILALKAKLAERPTSETKLERFERLRELISHSDGYAGSYTWDYLIDEVKDILAAHDEIMTIIDENKIDQSIKKLTVQISEWGNRWR